MGLMGKSQSQRNEKKIRKKNGQRQIIQNMDMLKINEN
jgi:hypothetical protein